ncbi:phosphate/phosphonate ABC transporter permease [Lentilactobacillus raoultii]|uniref:Phosphate/phosphonate ABC transporter permease n=1 Tax=Lentilactobacillus raoultii TaxID=1987503 RepID=A0ABW3PIZ3_9LACO|nr:phosphate/phosphonate ABC transporter permease [Lentilactobacillus raoultii]
MELRQTNGNAFFLKKRLKLTLLIGLIGVLYVGASLVLDFNSAAFLYLDRGIIWLAKNFIPNSQSMAYWQEILGALIRTLLVSVAATSVAAVISLGLALMGAKSTGPSQVVSWVIRGFASFMRNIPIVGWAMLLLFSFKQNDFTGFLALLFLSVGFLTRAFMETIEDVDIEKIQALQVTGANYFQVVSQAVLPEICTPLISWVLYMIENNLRDATLVGLLTGTGIGFVFDLYFKSLRYGPAGLVVLAIIILVIAVELSSNFVERRIAHD